MDSFDSRQADELATLLALFAHGSFAAAGRHLQRHPTVLSKRLSAMEQRLGIRLVERTTRQLRFTDEGLRLVERLQYAAGLISDAEREAAQGAIEIRGRLRLALPSSMGRLWLSPMLAEFALAFPQISIETEYAERFVDLVGEGFDAAIRIGELSDSRLVARKLCDHQRILCASPAYLERHGHPQSPAELGAHNCLGFTGLRSYPQWHLYSHGELQTVKVQGSMQSNDNEALLGVARAGVGIIAGGDWMMKKDLDGGTLLRVLAQWQLDQAAGVYFVRPGARFNTAATTAFKQWIELQFANGAPWR